MMRHGIDLSLEGCAVLGPALIRDDAAADAEAGVEHMVAASWRIDADAEICAMELLIRIVEPGPGGRRRLCPGAPLM